MTITKKQASDFFMFVYKNHYWQATGNKIVDQIIREVKFKNSYRELDYPVYYLINHVISASIPAEAKLFNIILYRLFNKPGIFGAFDGVIDPMNYDPEVLIQKADHFMRSTNESIMGIHPVYEVFDVSRPRDTYIQVLLSLKQLAKDSYILTRTINNTNNFGISGVMEMLGRYPNVRGCVLTRSLIDLSYTDVVSFDDNELCLLDNSSKWALSRIIGVKRADHHKYMYWTSCLQKLQKKYWTEMRDWSVGTIDWEKFVYPEACYPGPWLSMVNIIHCLREYTKYLKERSKREKDNKSHND